MEAPRHKRCLGLVTARAFCDRKSGAGFAVRKCSKNMDFTPLYVLLIDNLIPFNRSNFNQLPAIKFHLFD